MRKRTRNNPEANYQPLEPRQLLTTVFVVNSLADTANPVPDGQITFREALIAANTDQAFGDAPAGSGRDSISFDPDLNGRFTGPQNALQNRPFVITRPVEVSNARFGDFDGTFRIDTRGAVTFDNVSIDNGASDGSSAVTVTNGTLRVLNSNFRENVGRRISGGAINFRSSGTLWVKDSNFSKNEAVTANGSGGQGGAIFQSNGNLVVQGTNFADNAADRDGGVISVNGNSIDLTVSRSTFENNVSQQSGGAISVRSPNQLAEARISGSEFDGNRATHNGGAVSLKSARLLSASNLYHQNGGGINPTNNGGAIYADANGRVSLNNDRFESNRVIRNGGAIYSDGAFVESLNSRFHMNLADADGGAIYSAGNVTIRSTQNDPDRLIQGSSSRSFANEDTFEFVENRARESGGAIFVSGANLSLLGQNVLYGQTAGQSGSAIQVENGRLQLRNGILLGNERVNNGGGLYLQNSFANIDSVTFRSNEAQSGGGIYASDSRVRILDSDFSSNGATTGGHGYFLNTDLRVNNSNLSRGIAGKGGGGAFFLAGSSNLQAVDSAFTFNLGGLGIGNHGRGGALSIGPDASAQVFNSSFDNGFALAGGAVFNQGNLDVRNTLFTGNGAFDSDDQASTHLAEGSAILNHGTARISNSRFTENTALGGGTITNRGQLFVSMTDFDSGRSASVTSSIVDDPSVESGGGIINESGSAVLNDVSFTSNRAVRGGAIAVLGGSVLVVDAVFGGTDQGNTTIPLDEYRDRLDRADLQPDEFFGGSAVYVQGDASVTLRNAEFLSNRSAGGGAVALRANESGVPSVRISGESAFVNNSSGFRDGDSHQELYEFFLPQGGAIHNLGGTLDIRDVVFEGNTTLAEGGAIYNASNEFGTGELTLRRTTFTGNLSETSGAAIFNDAELLIVDSLLTNNTAPDSQIVSTSTATTTQVRTRIES